MEDHDAVYDAPWWHFWNPMSGPVGGLICGALIVLALLILMALGGEA